MPTFPLHDLESAPAEARPYLEAAQRKMGFLPHILAKMAEAPALLEAFLSLDEIFSRTSLSPAEQQVALLVISAANGCTFCVAAHSGGAAKAKVSRQEIARLRDLGTPDDPRLAAVARFARHLNEQRGWASTEEADAFLAAGFTKAQLLELVIACALKTLSNYTNHLVDTPLNEELAPLAWQPPRS